MKITTISPGLILFQSALMQTNTTLLVRPDHLLLVDPNWLPMEVEQIANHVEQVRAGRPLYLFFTHSDWDHIIGYERFREQAKVIVSANFLANPKPEEQLEAIYLFYDEYYLSAPWPVTYPQTADLVIGEAEATRQLGKDRYTFYQAPGHNADGLLAWHPDTGTLIVGDYLCTVEFPFIYYSVAAYRSTLDVLKQLLRALPVDTLICGHGPPTQDRAVMQQRLTDAYWYIDALERYSKEGVPFPEKALWERYPRYQRILRKFHAENLVIAKKN